MWLEKRWSLWQPLPLWMRAAILWLSQSIAIWKIAGRAFCWLRSDRFGHSWRNVCMLALLRERVFVEAIKSRAALKDNINANDHVPPPPSVPLESTVSKKHSRATRDGWNCHRPRHSAESLPTSWFVGERWAHVQWRGQANQGITAGVPNVRVIAPSRDSSSIWPLCNFSWCETPGRPPPRNIIMIYFPPTPVSVISRVRWEGSSLWNMFLRLAQTLPSSKLTVCLSLSCQPGSPSREQSRDRWKRSSLGVFNEGPAGTASGKTPRPVGSKTAAVRKRESKAGHTQCPCNLYFGRIFWQSQLGSRKPEQTTALV